MKNINAEMDHIDQINKQHGYCVCVDSILSMVIANLYSYINHEISFEDCRALVNENVANAFEGQKKVNIVPQDGKISLSIENLALLDQFFIQNGANTDFLSNIGDFLRKKDGKFGWSIEEFLQIENVRHFFIDSNKFFTENWKIFTENVTTEDTNGINVGSVSTEVLKALCTLENWDFEQIKRDIESKRFSDNFYEDITESLCFRGFENHALLKLKNNLHVFVVTVYDATSYEKCLSKFLLKFDPASSYHGFPFKVLRKVGKI